MAISKKALRTASVRNEATVKGGQHWLGSIHERGNCERVQGARHSYLWSSNECQYRSHPKANLPVIRGSLNGIGGQEHVEETSLRALIGWETGRSTIRAHRVIPTRLSQAKIPFLRLHQIKVYLVTTLVNPLRTFRGKSLKSQEPQCFLATRHFRIHHRRNSAPSSNFASLYRRT